jgi:hypothetical protein
MTAVLTVEGVIPEEEAILRFLKFYRLDDHAERLLKRPKKPVDRTQPVAAERTPGGQSFTPALRDHKLAGFNHPRDQVWIKLRSIGQKKYRTAEVGATPRLAVKKEVDGPGKITYRSGKISRYNNSRMTPTRRGK